MNRDYDVIVIGSGAGGLAAAVALARAGRRVLVLEQHYLPGGWCQSFSLRGYQFSPGVHYIGQLQPGGRMRAIYEGLGLADDLTFLELNPDGYDHVIVGDERFDIPKGRERYAERLKDRFPREAAGIDRYLEVVSRLAAEIDAGPRIRSLGELLTAPRRMPMLLRHGWRSFDRLLDRFTRDPLLRAVLSIQCGDHGLPPDRAPAALQAAVAAHYFDGGFYPKGGAKALPRAFIRALRRHGGEIRLRASVDRVVLERSGRLRAVGVKLATGEQISAHHVVSNADPHATFVRLVGREHVSAGLRRRLDRTTYSISALSLFLAVDQDLRAAGLDSGNYWYGSTPRVADAYAVARTTELLDGPTFPGLFATVTTLKDPSKRRDGIHTMESFCFVGYDAFRRWADSRYGSRPRDYEQLKERLMDKMLRTLENVAPGISGRVVFRELGTPLSNLHYLAATQGNLYGTEKRFRQLGAFSFPVRTEIPGLLMCGASTLGHGVAGATASGLAAARSILRCRSRDILTGRGSLRILPCDDPASWPASAAPNRTEAVLA